MGFNFNPPPITLLRHYGASQVYLFEDPMGVKMQMLGAENGAWNSWVEDKIIDKNMK